MKRLFVAVEIPKKIREKVFVGTIAPLQKVKKVAEENLHITLCFIGETEGKRETEIIEKLSEIEFPTFFVFLGKTGTFGKKVMWVKAESAEIAGLAAKISEKLRIKNNFSGHLTVARAKNEADFESEFEKIRNVEINEEFAVKSFFLVKSALTSSGPIHEKEKEFPLKGKGSTIGAGAK